MLTLIIGITGGCTKRRKVERSTEKRQTHEQVQNEPVTIPFAQNKVHSFFDDDLEEFELIDSASEPTFAAQTGTQDIERCHPVEDFLERELAEEFAWVDAEEKDADKALKVIYFDFDRFNVKQSEVEKLAYNIDALKKVIAEEEKAGNDATVVIEGHACHAAGSAVYNMAISERRAKTLADRMVTAGIPRNKIKIVGRGKEFPAIAEGKPVTGDRQQQWLNRRDEITVINA